MLIRRIQNVTLRVLICQGRSASPCLRFTIEQTGEELGSIYEETGQVEGRFLEDRFLEDRFLEDRFHEDRFLEDRFLAPNSKVRVPL